MFIVTLFIIARSGNNSEVHHLINGLIKYGLVIEQNIIQLWKGTNGLPGGPGVKNLPCNACHAVQP